LNTCISKGDFKAPQEYDPTRFQCVGDDGSLFDSDFVPVEEDEIFGEELDGVNSEG
jgi:hypothetical protein